MSLESRINYHINHWLSNNAKQSVYRLSDEKDIPLFKAFQILHPVRYEVEEHYNNFYEERKQNNINKEDN